MSFSRRTALLWTATKAATSLAGVTGLAGLAASSCKPGRQREPWATGPRLRNGHPVLRMPFPAGTAVLCQQGNLSPSGRTHFKDNSRHAIDFSNISVPSLDVIAAAPGRVGYVYDAAPPDDKKAGFGFGNQVKIEHGDGYFTMYAHLEQVSVRVGDIVAGAARSPGSPRGSITGSESSPAKGVEKTTPAGISAKACGSPWRCPSGGSPPST